jgi:hypothetical protein
MFNYCVIILSKYIIKFMHLEELRNAYSILVGKSEGKRPFRKEI